MEEEGLIGKFKTRRQIKNAKHIKYINPNVEKISILDLINDEDEHQNLDISNITFTPNINDYIKVNIPETLNTKFDLLKEKYNNRTK